MSEVMWLSLILDRIDLTQYRFRILIVGRVRLIPVPLSPRRPVHGSFYSLVWGNRRLSTLYSRLLWRYSFFRHYVIIQHLRRHLG